MYSQLTSLRFESVLRLTHARPPLGLRESRPAEATPVPADSGPIGLKRWDLRLGVGSLRGKADGAVPSEVFAAPNSGAAQPLGHKV